MGIDSLVPEARLESDDFATERLLVTKVVGREAIGELFHFDVDVYSMDKEAIERGDVLGASCRLVLSSSHHDPRIIHGVVWALERKLEVTHFDGSAGFGSRHYRLRIVPRAARLGLLVTQDIFQDKSIPDIIADKLRIVEIEGADVNRLSLLSSYPARDFVTQYAESDLAFVCRWCEHLGISFYFEHTHGADRIVFSDNPAGFVPYEGCRTLSLSARGDEPERLLSLRVESEVMPANFIVMDYDYRKPDLELTCTHESKLGLAGGVFEYGGHFRSLDAGAALAKVRAEERESQSHVYRAESIVWRVSAGHRYLVECESDFETRELLVVSVEHELVPSAEASSGAASYKNRFVAVAADQRYRPPRRTPWPRIPGLLSGVIEPKSHGETEDPACIDDLGRYWVKFLYDTAPLGHAKASKPIRMALPSAGPRSGIHFPLRPGVEVALAFINGDPDRPIIVGALHNAKVVPHVVDDNQQVNTIETTSGIRMRFKDTLQRR